jgi:hypothetical protein
MTRPPARPGAPDGRYAKKPLVVRAIQWTGDNYDDVCAFHGEAFEAVESPDGTLSLLIPTLEGDMLASPGDWLIRGVVNELYPCKPQVFAASYASPPPPLVAHRWKANGDHPDDGDDPTREGAVVRYFRHPGYYGTTTCPVCHALLHLHGWIDQGEDGHTVCPGDWIITTADGRHLPVKPDVYAYLREELPPHD